MTDFVENCNNPMLYNLKEESPEYGNNRFLECVKYMKFLKQPLTLGIFVPCDEKGKPMKHPDEIEDTVNDSMTGAIQVKNYKLDYQEAKERVLFEGFEVGGIYHNSVHFKSRGIARIFYTKDNYYHNYGRKHTEIEDLLNQNITLTKTAQKQIGL